MRQVAGESGWNHLRQELQRRYHLSADSFRPRDDWLVGQLLSQVEILLVRLEAGQGLTPQEQITLTDLHTLATESGADAHPPLKALP